jgi:hypothetical protein
MLDHSYAGIQQQQIRVTVDYAARPGSCRRSGTINTT